jgi:hypothetical protein
VTPHTAEEGQTSFPATYTPDYADVYLNGVRLSDSEYTKTSGTSIVLDDPASLNDIIEIVSYSLNIVEGASGLNPIMMGMIF